MNTMSRFPSEEGIWRAVRRARAKYGDTDGEVILGLEPHASRARHPGEVREWFRQFRDRCENQAMKT